jgi:hypothetical protein
MVDPKNVNNQVLEIKEGNGIAKESKRDYYYVDILINGTQITRLFPKDTEKTYFKSLLGSFVKMD